MSDVNLILTAKLLTPGVLRLHEITPVASWGGTAAPRSSVDTFLVTITYPGKPGFTYQTDGRVASTLSSGLFLVNAADLLTSLPHCTCWVGQQPAFRSGCLNVSVQAIDTRTETRYPTNFTIRLRGGLPACGAIWVKKEGAYIDVTAEGGLINAQWQWQTLSSLDDYRDWKLLVNGIQVDTGAVLVERTSDTGTSKSINYTVGYGAVTLFITGTERQAWSDKVASLLRPGTSGLACNDLMNTALFPSDHCREGKLAYIGQLLDILEGIRPNEFSAGLAIDCQSGDVLLKRVQAELRAWH